MIRSTEYLDAKFSIQTDAGSISVEEWFGKFLCTGNTKALIVAGIVHADWIIAGRKSWCIVFDDDSARLHIGGRGVPKGRHIKIDTYCCDRGEHRAWLPISNKQKERLIEMYNAWHKEKEARESGYQLGHLAGSMTNDERFLIAGFRACSTGQQEILLDIARRGYAKRAESAKPKYRTEGNVVFLPGRGSVPPVSPSSLQ